MRAASPAFHAAVAGPHQIHVKAEVLYGDVVVSDSLQLDGGSIQYDMRAARYSRLQCTLAEPTELPLDPSDFLTPFGYEIRIWHGVVLQPGTSGLVKEVFWNGSALVGSDGLPWVWGSTTDTIVELVPVGTFPIQAAQIEGRTLSTQITAEDRSRIVTDFAFDSDYLVAAGVNYVTALQALLTAVAPFEYLVGSTVHTTPQLVFGGDDDRWGVAIKMAAAIGMWLRMDGLGRVLLTPEPTFESPSVVRLSGSTNLVDLGVGLDRGPGYNRVYAFSTNASLGAQYSGAAVDNNPASPTYYYGVSSTGWPLFGRKTLRFGSPLLASNTQCEQAAATRLSSLLGVVRSVQFGMVPNPLWEPGDVVLVESTQVGLSETHLIETMTLPLGPAASTGTTRTRFA